jgi:hypothetical protein
MHGLLDYVPFGLLVIAFVGLVGGGLQISFLFGKSHQKLDSIEGMIEERFARVGDRITVVEKQFKPNGGSSLKDDLSGLKGDVRDLKTRQDIYFQLNSGGNSNGISIYPAPVEEHRNP